MKKLLTAAVLACALAAFVVPLAGANASSVTDADGDQPRRAHCRKSGHMRVRHRRASQGNPRRHRLHRPRLEPRPPCVIHLRAFTITYTNPLSGKSLSTPLAGPAIGEPLADGTWLVTVPGNDGRFVIPGQGIVFANVGLRIGVHVGIFSGAIDDVIKSVGIQDASEFPAVCSGLA